VDAFVITLMSGVPTRVVTEQTCTPNHRSSYTGSQLVAIVVARLILNSHIDIDIYFDIQILGLHDWWRGCIHCAVLTITGVTTSTSGLEFEVLGRGTSSFDDGLGKVCERSLHLRVL